MRWVSTHDQEADDPSRITEVTDARLNARLRSVFSRVPYFNLDAFAQSRTKVCHRFVSLDFSEDSQGFDAMAYPYKTTDHLYAYPPTPLAADFARICQKYDLSAVFLQHRFKSGTNYMHARLLESGFKHR